MLPFYPRVTIELEFLSLCMCSMQSCQHKQDRRLIVVGITNEVCFTSDTYNVSSLMISCIRETSRALNSSLAAQLCRAVGSPHSSHQT